MIRFLAEIALRVDVIFHFTPSSSVSRDYNVYEIYIGPPPFIEQEEFDIEVIDEGNAGTDNADYQLALDGKDAGFNNEYDLAYVDPANIEFDFPPEGYWSAWGGTYNHYQGTNIELYFGQFLQRVNSMEELKSTAMAMFVDTGALMCYFSVPVHPWLYPEYASEGEDVLPFLSAPLDPLKPSQNLVRGVPAPVKLSVPDFSVKLSEGLSGVVLNQGFSLDFTNNDGYFDDDALWDLFNTPVHLKKAVKENPAYGDFREIRGGHADSIRTSFDKFTVTVSDKLRAMNEPVCAAVTQAGFPHAALSYDAAGKNIPVVYGTKKVKLLKLNEEGTAYLAAEYLDKVLSVYDNEGNTIPFSQNPDNTLIILAENAETAKVTGYTNNRIGEVVVDLIVRKTGVSYIPSVWNTDETDEYKTISPPVNIAFTGGDVKKAVQDVLKSDMAYLIQQTDGKLTLRKYGWEYNSHTAQNWQITKKPEKDYDNAQKNYFSSCLIKYNYTSADRETYREYLYDAEEQDAENRYRKLLRKEYETDLAREQDARALAALLASRYAVMRQRIKLAVGFDTAHIELLDTLYIDAIRVNGRTFSKSRFYHVTEINPAQDILMLEEIDEMIIDEGNAGTDNADYQLALDGKDAVYDNERYKLILDAGRVY